MFDASRTLSEIGAAHPAVRPLLNPLAVMFGGEVAVGWIACVAALLPLCAVLIYIIYRPSRTFGLIDCLRFLFPAKIYGSTSFRVDALFFLIAPNIAALYKPDLWPILTDAARRSAADLVHVLGAAGTGPVLASAVQWHHYAAWSGLFAFAMILGADLGTYATHVLQHRIPALWEFHKVHHSATVLTPLTAFREHPLLIIVNLTSDAFVSALVYAGLALVFGPFFISQFSPAQGLAVYIVRNLLFLHGHLFVPVSYRYLNWLIVSPALHSIHHSNHPAHHNRNFSAIFPVWDFLFRTLHVPTRDELEQLSCGLPANEHQEYSSVLRLYFLPLKKIAGYGSD